MSFLALLRTSRGVRRGAAGPTHLGFIEPHPAPPHNLGRITSEAEGKSYSPCAFSHVMDGYRRLDRRKTGTGPATTSSDRDLSPFRRNRPASSDVEKRTGSHEQGFRCQRNGLLLPGSGGLRNPTDMLAGDLHVLPNLHIRRPAGMQGHRGKPRTSGRRLTAGERERWRGYQLLSSCFWGCSCL